MPRTDRASRLIPAPIEDVFAALSDRAALERWLPPAGMRGHFEHFDFRPGGSYRLVLTYDGAAGSPGKATSDSDIVEARLVGIVRNGRIAQEIDFVSDHPEFAGTMLMTWTTREVAGGTTVEITAAAVPDGISEEDHATGMASSLENLATYLSA